MSSEVSLDSIDDESLEFIKDFPIEWEGRQITLKDLPILDAETAQRVRNLFECLIAESEDSDEIAAYLARTGTSPQNHSLVARDVQQLICTPDGVLQQVGFKKSLSKFWHKHKKAIIIGAIVVAVVVTTVVVVSACTAAGAAAAGAAAIDSVNKAKPKEPGQGYPVDVSPEPSSSITLPESQLSSTLPNLKAIESSRPYLPEPCSPPDRITEPLVQDTPKPSFFDFLDPQYKEKIPYPLPIAPTSTLEKFFPPDQKIDLPQAPAVETPISSAMVEWERNLARERQRLEQERVAALVNRLPEPKNLDTYAALAANGNFTKDFKVRPPFQEMPLIGAAHQSTVHYHCGIANDAKDVSSGGHCLFESLDKGFAVHPHHIHPKSLLWGLDKVGIQKIDEKCKDPIVQFFFGGILTKIPEYLLKNTEIEQSIQYEVENLSTIAQKILERNNPNLKQLHVTFSNGGYIFREALKRLPEEHRNTVIVITTGSTKFIEENLACLAHNIVGDKDLGSQICNGWGLEYINGVERLNNVIMIPQRETMSVIGGHYFTQPDYQREVSNFIIGMLFGKYEIF